MTITELMDNLAEKIRVTVEEYRTAKDNGAELNPVAVYAGYPPARTGSDSVPSFIYVLATSAKDTLEQSTATVEIAFNIYDNDTADGWRSLFNLAEHVRQALLKDRCIARRNILVPSANEDGCLLRMDLVTEQPWPNWQAKLTATYTIGQPQEEDFNVGFY